jgi:hypothetical protein
MQLYNFRMQLLIDALSGKITANPIANFVSEFQ